MLSSRRLTRDIRRCHELGDTVRESDAQAGAHLFVVAQSFAFKPDAQRSRTQLHPWQMDGLQAIFDGAGSQHYFHEVGNVNPGSLHACYNAWQLRLQITWLLEHRGQPVVVPRTKAAMIKKWIDLLSQTTTRQAPNTDDDSPGEDRAQSVHSASGVRETGET